MSANNQIVVVAEAGGKFSVWYDGCVDNPFPNSASKVKEFDNLKDAVDFASKQDDGFVEYGIRFVDGPVPCSYIHHDQDWEYCCSQIHGHQGMHDKEIRWA